MESDHHISSMWWRSYLQIFINKIRMTELIASACSVGEIWWWLSIWNFTSASFWQRVTLRNTIDMYCAKFNISSTKYQNQCLRKSYGLPKYSTKNMWNCMHFTCNFAFSECVIGSEEIRINMLVKIWKIYFQAHCIIALCKNDV